MVISTVLYSNNGGAPVLLRNDGGKQRQSVGLTTGVY
jgi:hypothetical protein